MGFFELIEWNFNLNSSAFPVLKFIWNDAKPEPICGKLKIKDPISLQYKHHLNSMEIHPKNSACTQIMSYLHVDVPTKINTRLRNTIRRNYINNNDGSNFISRE